MVGGAHFDGGDGCECRLEKVFEVGELGALFMQLFKLFTVDASLLELLDAQCPNVIVLSFHILQIFLFNIKLCII